MLLTSVYCIHHLRYLSKNSLLQESNEYIHNKQHCTDNFLIFHIHKKNGSFTKNVLIRVDLELSYYTYDQRGQSCNTLALAASD